jgi:hypothetical protein
MDPLPEQLRNVHNRRRLDLDRMNLGGGRRLTEQRGRPEQLPALDQRSTMLGSELPKPHGVIVPERHKHRRRAAIGPLARPGGAQRAVRSHEGEALRHEQDSRRPLPADAEPLRFGPGMQQGGAVAVLGKPANPTAHLVAVEGGIEPHAPCPGLAKAVVGPA